MTHQAIENVRGHGNPMWEWRPWQAKLITKMEWAEMPWLGIRLSPQDSWEKWLETTKAPIGIDKVYYISTCDIINFLKQKELQISSCYLLSTQLRNLLTHFTSFMVKTIIIDKKERHRNLEARFCKCHTTYKD